jgi:hypothetical protein
MAFGGSPSFITQAAGLKNVFVFVGAELSARVGSPDPANADTGQLTTGTPGPNQLQIPTRWGRGPGSWRDSDLARVHPALNISGDAVAGAIPDVYIVVGTVADGNLTLTFHNRGAAASGVIFFRLRYDHSLIR